MKRNKPGWEARALLSGKYRPCGGVVLSMLLSLTCASVGANGLTFTTVTQGCDRGPPSTAVMEVVRARTARQDTSTTLIENSTQGPLLVRVGPITGQGPSGNAFIPSGQAAVFPGQLTQDYVVQVESGSNFCSLKSGWQVQGRTTVARMGTSAAKGAARLTLEGDPSVANGMRIALAMEEAEGAKRAREAEAARRAQQALAGRAGQGIVEQSPQVAARTTNWTPMQAVPPTQMKQREMRAVDEEPLELSEGDVALRSGVRRQDYRDVPGGRDMRLVTNGSTHLLHGKVGDEDVQFRVERNWRSYIGAAQARRAGASRCVEGHYVIAPPTFTTNCTMLIPRIQFGPVTLENVMIGVVAGEALPVIGRDLLGPSRIIDGRDGAYLRANQ